MSENKARIAVYFNSGNKAVLDDDLVEFRDASDVPTLPIAEYHGRVLVNWANVCFVREVEEKHDDDAE